MYVFTTILSRVVVKSGSQIQVPIEFDAIFSIFEILNIASAKFIVEITLWL